MIFYARLFQFSMASFGDVVYIVNGLTPHSGFEHHTVTRFDQFAVNTSALPPQNGHGFNSI